MSSDTSASPKEEPTFEAALARLETIVAEMEGGRLSLEANLARFEEGVRLSRLCAEKLAASEKKIEMLMRNAEGDLAWQPWESADGGPDATGTRSDP